VRYPRGSGPGVPIAAALETLPVGKGVVRREAKRRAHRVAILAFGGPLAAALEAGEAHDATVANMRFVKPLDVELVLALARTHDLLVTVEENVIAGGAGSAVGEALAAAGVEVPLMMLGLPDRFVDHGEPALLVAHVGLDAEAIAAAIARRVGPLDAKAWAKPAAA